MIGSTSCSDFEMASNTGMWAITLGFFAILVADTALATYVVAQKHTRAVQAGLGPL